MEQKTEQFLEALEVSNKYEEGLGDVAHIVGNAV
jgi:hypothetical protein